MRGAASFDKQGICEVNKKEERVTNMPDTIDNDTKIVKEDSVQNSEETSAPEGQHVPLEPLVFPETQTAPASTTDANLETAAEGTFHSTRHSTPPKRQTYECVYTVEIEVSAAMFESISHDEPGSYRDAVASRDAKK